MHGAGRLHRRLLEMGFTEGTRIRVAREAPLGDPVDYEVRGYHVSLRRSEACLIIVRREP
ncbi:MAG: ferrous iron transport protein A [Planctomycetes bacterium]|nr:ferrous iron transport protein A [Planctomycetota bacterium]